MNTERAAVLAETLNEFRQNRHKIRAVEIISECCSTCDLDSNREFALDAVPILPHAHCTNPEGCVCYYSPVLQTAPLPDDAIPRVYPPVVLPPRPSGIPAYLKTPAAAMIMLGAVVIAFGIGLINSNTSGKHGEMVTHPQMSAAVPASAMQNTHTTKVSLVPVSLLTVTRTEDREADAKAARDLQTAERIARENEAARRAQETAVQQQAYVQTLLSRQAQMPQISVGSPSLQRSGRVSAVSAAVSSTVR